MNGGLERFAGDYEAFEWSERKRALNLATHRIDFVDAPLFFGHRPILRRRSDRRGEVRYFAMGWLRGRVVVLVYTEECGPRCCRVVSLRPASDRERELFHAQVREE